MNHAGPVVRRLVLLTILFLFMLPRTGYAADAQVTADLSRLADAVEQLLEQHSLEEQDAAETEHFLLVYATQSTGEAAPFITISARSIGAALTRVSITTDTPRETRTETQLLRDLVKLTTE